MQATELLILNWIQTHLRCDFLDVVMPAVSWTCNHGELWILLALCLLAVRRHPAAGVGGGLRPADGPGQLQPAHKAAGGPRAALCRLRRGGAFDGAAAGCLVSLRPYGSLFCGGLCPAKERQQALEAGAGSRRGDRLFPAVSLCPLAQRCAGRRRFGRGLRHAGAFLAKKPARR